jgi:hypothetical protein
MPVKHHTDHFGGNFLHRESLLMVRITLRQQLDEFKAILRVGGSLSTYPEKLQRLAYESYSKRYGQVSKNRILQASGLQQER